MSIPEDGKPRSPKGLHAKQLIFEIVAIGNELLIGKTQDTNSHWLAVQISDLGGVLRRITTVRDRHEEIGGAIRCALSRHPDFLLTLGGLGPTHDDITLASISRLLKRRLVLNPRAVEFLRSRYLTRFGPHVKLTPPRLKMARFPSGATPLPNPVGTAPAPCLVVHGTTLIALPGVPKEMRAIFRSSIKPIIEGFGSTYEFHEHSLLLRGIPESSLSPLIDEVMRKHRLVFIKSHPRGIEKDGSARIELHFRIGGTSRDKMLRELKLAVAQMRRRLRGKAIARDLDPF
jgi:molybdenum cofactor synthesis domain-containing protein